MPIRAGRVRCVAGVAGLTVLLAGCATQPPRAVPDEPIGVGALTAQCDGVVQVAPTAAPVPAAAPAPSPSPSPDGFLDANSAAPPGLVAAGYTVLWYLPGAPSGVLSTLLSLVTYLRRLDGFAKVVAAPGDPTMFSSRKNLVMDRMLGSVEVRQTCGQVSQHLVMQFMELGPVSSAAPVDNAPGTNA
ncbi:MAG TPA: hypothetical protein VGL04_09255 [Sporichthyaceae bacterium]